MTSLTIFVCVRLAPKPPLFGHCLLFAFGRVKKVAQDDPHVGHFRNAIVCIVTVNRSSLSNSLQIINMKDIFTCFGEMCTCEFVTLSFTWNHLFLNPCTGWILITFLSCPPHAIPRWRTLSLLYMLVLILFCEVLAGRVLSKQSSHSFYLSNLGPFSAV